MKTSYQLEILTHKKTGKQLSREQWWDIWDKQSDIDTWEEFCKLLKGFQL